MLKFPFSCLLKINLMFAAKVINHQRKLSNFASEWKKNEKKKLEHKELFSDLKT